MFKKPVHANPEVLDNLVNLFKKRLCGQGNTL